MRGGSVVLFWALVGCGLGDGELREVAEEAPIPAEEPPQAAADRRPVSGAEEAAIQRAEEAISQLATSLRGELMSAMAEGGPVEAVKVCADQAPGLAALAGAVSKAKVGRTTDRPRNPENAGPDWALARLQGWKAQGSFEGEVSREVVAVDGGEVARVVRPIAIEAPCLACHGDPAGIPEEVRGAIEGRYPTDRATGYALGELRGVWWAEAGVEPVAGQIDPETANEDRK